MFMFFVNILFLWHLYQVRKIFENVNENSNVSNYQLFLMENYFDPRSETIYKPYKVLKNVCSQIERGARVMVGI